MSLLVNIILSYPARYEAGRFSRINAPPHLQAIPPPESEAMTLLERIA